MAAAISAAGTTVRYAAQEMGSVHCTEPLNLDRKLNGTDAHFGSQRPFRSPSLNSPTTATSRQHRFTMKWFTDLSALQPVAYAVFVLAAVAVLGLALGHVKVRSIQLGVAGVLFAGIIFGHFHLTLTPETLGFVRDFGLILFVYTIGIQVGPGFLTSLRRQRLPLNALAVGIFVGGAALTVASSWLLHIDMAAAVGIFSGATTNILSLGAAQEALKQTPGIDAARASLPALGYAVAYPFGIIGIILAMVMVCVLLKIDPAKEAKAFETEQLSATEPLHRMNVRVCNHNLNGLRLHEIPSKDALGVVISRVKYLGESEVSGANADTILHEGDILLAVGTAKSLHEFCLIVGQESPEDLMETPGHVGFRRFMVTRKAILGKTIRELDLTQRYGGTVTRVMRSEIEMTAVPNLTRNWATRSRSSPRRRTSRRSGRCSATP